MAERAQFTRLWGDPVVASLRYYGRMGRLAVAWVAAAMPAVTEVRAWLSPMRDRTSDDHPMDTPLVAIGHRRSMVVEAEVGKQAHGVFLVENRTASSVSASTIVSAFADESGREIHPIVQFQPDVLTLAPGEQAVVQITATVDETLEPDVPYQAELSIPGLSTAGIPLVLRRRSSAPPGNDTALPVTRASRKRPATAARRQTKTSGS